MHEAPRVSVVVPNYNHCPFLPMRLKSIQQQTLRDFELILLDDASTDGSVDRLRSFAAEHGAKLIINSENSGSPFHQWNRGVEAARGKYVWIAESDDVAEPDLLEKLVAVLDAHQDVGLVSCDSVIIDEAGQQLGRFDRESFALPADRWSHTIHQAGRAEITDAMYFANTIISASACVFRRQVYLDAGAADATFKLAGDYLHWCKLLLRSEFVFVPEPLNYSRVHARTQRMATNSDGRRELETMRVQRWVREHLTVHRELVVATAQRQATSWLQGVRAGRYSGPLSRHVDCFLQLWQADPEVAFECLFRFPYCLLVWFVKRSRQKK